MIHALIVGTIWSSILAFALAYLDHMILQEENILKTSDSLERGAIVFIVNLVFAFIIMYNFGTPTIPLVAYLHVTYWTVFDISYAAITKRPTYDKHDNYKPNRLSMFDKSFEFLSQPFRWHFRMFLKISILVVTLMIIL